MRGNQVVHLRGTGMMEIARQKGFSHPLVRKAFNLFNAGGWPAINPASRGRSDRVEIGRVNVLDRKAIKLPYAELNEVLGAVGACTGSSATSSRDSA